MYMYEKYSIVINSIILILMILNIFLNIRKNKISMFYYDFQIKFYALYIFPIIFVVFNIFFNTIFKLPFIFWLITTTPIVIPISTFLIERKNMKKTKKLYLKYNLDIQNTVIELLKLEKIKINKDNIYIFLNCQENIIYCKAIIEKDLKTLKFNNILETLKEGLYKKYPEIKFDIILEK